MERRGLSPHHRRPVGGLAQSDERPNTRWQSSAARGGRHEARARPHLHQGPIPGRRSLRNGRRLSRFPRCTAACLAAIHAAFAVMLAPCRTIGLAPRDRGCRCAHPTSKPRNDQHQRRKRRAPSSRPGVECPINQGTDSQSGGMLGRSK